MLEGGASLCIAYSVLIGMLVGGLSSIAMCVGVLEGGGGGGL